MRQVILLISVLAGACVAPSTGELGRAHFVWSEGLSCILGCDAAEAVVRGGDVSLIVTNDDELPAFLATSEDPSVLAVDHSGGGSIGVTGVSDGSTRVLLHETGGAELDRFRVRVRTAEGLSLRSPRVQSRLLVMTGGETTLQIEVTGGGEELVGHGAVTYTLGGGLGPANAEVTPLDGLSRLFTGTAPELASVHALAPGAGSIELAAVGGASASIPFEVVEASAITQISLEVEVDGAEATIEASAHASDGERIHAPVCAWTIDPASGPLTLLGPPGSTATVSASAAGQATVTCAIGSQTASANVSISP